VTKRKSGTRLRKTRRMTLASSIYKSSFRSENRTNKKLSLKITKIAVLARLQAPSLQRRVDRDKMNNLSALSHKI